MSHAVEGYSVSLYHRKMKKFSPTKTRAKAKFLMNQAHKAALESVRLQELSAKLENETKRLLRKVEKMTRE